MAKEKAVVAAIVRLLKKYKAAGEPIWWTKIHGGAFQQAGIPDLLVVLAGRAYFFEVKSPGGRWKVTRLQAATMTAIHGAWAVAKVVESAEEVADALADHLTKRQPRRLIDIL